MSQLKDPLEAPVAPRFVIVMGCSATKRETTSDLTALDRYDGPMWKTLRAQLERLPAAADAYRTGELEIMVMSALYGFIKASNIVPNYDKRMSPELALKMSRDPSYEFQMLGHLVDDAQEVLFAAGAIYRDAMWRGAGGNLAHLMKITETDGGGIGEHRAQLAAWMQKNFAKAELELAA